MIEKAFNFKFQKEKYSAFYCKTPAQAESIMGFLIALPRNTLFGVDVETERLPEWFHLPEAALSPHLSKVRLLQICYGRAVYIFDLKYIEDYTIFVWFLSSRRLVAHYALFELMRFKQWGVTNCNIACTKILAMLISQAYYPTDIGLKYDLESLIEKWFETKVVKVEGKSDWAIPELTFEQIRYAALDAVFTLKLAEKLSHGIPKYGLERIYKLMKDVQHPIASMQLNGIGFDLEHHRAIIPIWKDAVYKAKQEAMKITGLVKLTPTTLSNWLEDNLTPEQKNDWPKTPTKKLSTSSTTFSEFDFLPVIKPFTTYQKKATLCSGFGQKLINFVNPKTKRVHGSLNICGARTGRFSSSKPNMQNCPRSPSEELKALGEPDVRESFIAAKGNLIICADYSMIEIRVGAEQSRDVEMLKAFRNGIDLHKLTASIVSRIPLAKVTKEQRQSGKALNFGLMFGLGATKYAQYAKKNYGVVLTAKQAMRDVAAWHELYYGYTEWQQEIADKAKASLKCVTPCGKLRALTEDKCYGSAMNQGPQGGACEVLSHALVRLDREQNRNFKLINTVHDEICSEVLESKVEKYCHVVERCMIEGFLDVFPSGIAKGLVSIGYGKSWADAK